MIREDSVEDFIIYINKSNISLQYKINRSIFETNSLLLKSSEVTLIEYAAFYGSLQIFQYLKFNNAEMNHSLWLYAIHGRNAEIIHLLEEIDITPKNNDYMICIEESIKCFHNEFANYFQNKYFQNNDENSKETFLLAIENYNFEFMPKELFDQSSLIYLCHWDYYKIVEFLTKDKNVNFNQLFVFKISYQIIK